MTYFICHHLTSTNNPNVKEDWDCPCDCSSCSASQRVTLEEIRTIFSPATFIVGEEKEEEKKEEIERYYCAATNDYQWGYDAKCSGDCETCKYGLKWTAEEAERWLLGGK